MEMSPEMKNPQCRKTNTLTGYIKKYVHENKSKQFFKIKPIETVIQSDLCPSENRYFMSQKYCLFYINVKVFPREIHCKLLHKRNTSF